MLWSVPSAAQESELSVDLNNDGRAEVFALVRTADGMDLHITDTGSPPITVRNIVFSGPMFGQEAALELAPNGSVLLTSMNDAIGRNRWEQVLTIAYRNDAYRVAGITWRERDTHDINAWMACDINLLTGKGEIEDRRGKRAVQGKADARLVTEWSEDEPMPPSLCR